MKPGRCVVLLTREADALWVTSWPYAEYVRHAWAGAWECSTFRNEGPVRSSSLIREAVAVTRHVYGEPPELGMITFVDPTKVRTGRASMPERALGKCYRKAGFRAVGETKGGLLAFQMRPEDMPEPMEPSPRVHADGTIQGVLALG